MVRLLKTDKTETEINPKNGKKFALEELQDYVGGNIECPRMPDGSILIINENGKFQGLPINYLATQIWIEHFGIGSDIVLGNVVVMSRKEWQDWNAMDEEE